MDKTTKSFRVGMAAAFGAVGSSVLAALVCNLLGVATVPALIIFVSGVGASVGAGLGRYTE